MRVLYFQPLITRPKLYHIENELASMQQLVCGYIEAVRLGDGLVLICDEEARLKGLPPNRIIDGHVICGPCFICREDGDQLTELSYAEAVRLRDREFQRWMPAGYAAV